MRKESPLFKDKSRLNIHTSDPSETYCDNLAELWNMVSTGQLLKDMVSHPETKPHPRHLHCAGFHTSLDNSKNEKRICHCMFFYGKELPQCAQCKLKTKWHNVSSQYEIIEFEYPTPYKIENLGGIDLLIRDRNTETIYATEVKPPEGNPETLVRMMAEALTYMAAIQDAMPNWQEYSAHHKADRTLFDRLPDAIPAICFFEGSSQENDFNSPNIDIRNNADYQKIVQKTTFTVFSIHIESQKNDLTEFSINMLSRAQP